MERVWLVVPRGHGLMTDGESIPTVVYNNDTLLVFICGSTYSHGLAPAVPSWKYVVRLCGEERNIMGRGGTTVPILGLRFYRKTQAKRGLGGTLTSSFTLRSFLLTPNPFTPPPPPTSTPGECVLCNALHVPDPVSGCAAERSRRERKSIQRGE